MVYPCLRLIFSLAERSLGPRRFWHSDHLAHQPTGHYSTGMSFPSFCDETDFLPELLQSTASSTFLRCPLVTFSIIRPTRRATADASSTRPLRIRRFFACKRYFTSGRIYLF